VVPPVLVADPPALVVDPPALVADPPALVVVPPVLVVDPPAPVVVPPLSLVVVVPELHPDASAAASSTGPAKLKLRATTVDERLLLFIRVSLQVSLASIKGYKRCETGHCGVSPNLGFFVGECISGNAAHSILSRWLTWSKGVPSIVAVL
jgi:hypothetical protein